MGIKRRLFLDTITSKIDAKGRVSVPAEYRTVLDESDAELVLFRSFTSPCIEAVSSLFLEKMASQIEGNYSLFSPEQEDLTSLIFAESKIFTPDSTGRISLTEKLIKHAGLTDSATFVGKGKTFQIWDSATLAQRQTLTRERLKEQPLVLPMKEE
ncbi:MAG: division/cell wall cluster transcriptional repressor MraZ [Alphaproteobacteria bacterium]|nr:division/cell wall cluster transcriptional repressor MraZ [Alphaproteobacteria bacterium]